jgi:carboxypeptidase C (cathepsin A)
MDKQYVYNASAYTSEGFNWDWKHKKSDSPDWGDVVTPNTVVDLVEAMNHNPNLKVLVLNGYYDLATPFFATEYTFDHLGIENKLKQNISLKYYPAGHMMYIHSNSANVFKKDVAGFINDSSK